MRAITVLLTDDECEFTTILSKVLRRRGFEVEVAADGVSALAALSRQWFDVVVLDVKMPGQDGIQTLGEIKSRAPSPEVILLTGHVSGVEESNGLKTGAFAYLLKPHPIQDIICCIEAAAARSRETRHVNAQPWAASQACPGPRSGVVTPADPGSEAGAGAGVQNPPPLGFRLPPE